MLLVACLAAFLSGPAQTYGVSVFVEPMIEDLGWSRPLYSTMYSVVTLLGAGVLVLVGHQIDRVDMDDPRGIPQSAPAQRSDVATMHVCIESTRDSQHTQYDRAH